MYDNLLGVGRFVRKSDNTLTLLETGTDCQEVRDNLSNLFKKESSDTKKKLNMLFNSVAEEYTYH